MILQLNSVHLIKITHLMKTIKKIFKYFFLTLLILLTGAFIWILWPNSESDFDDTPRESTQYWKLNTGSRIAFTLLKSEVPTVKSTIIYLHGGPGAYIGDSKIEIYKEIAKKGYDVLLYDQVGCGLSERLNTLTEYTVERHANDLKEIIKKLNADHITLVGQSWGGFLASYFAAYHPSLVDKLILTAPGQIRPIADSNIYKTFGTPEYINDLTKIDGHTNEVNNEINDFSAREIAWLIISNITESNFLISDHKVDGILHKMSKTFTKVMGCNSSITSSTSTGRPGMFCSIFTNKSFNDVAKNIRDEMRKFEKPVLILKPQCDYLDWQFAHEYTTIFSNSNLKVIKNAGHSISSENKEDYISEIVTFVEKNN